MKIKARKKKKKNNDLELSHKPLEALNLPHKPNSIPLILGKKSYYLGDKSPKKGKKKPP